MMTRETFQHIVILHLSGIVMNVFFLEFRHFLGHYN